MDRIVEGVQVRQAALVDCEQAAEVGVGRELCVQTLARGVAFLHQLLVGAVVRSQARGVRLEVQVEAVGGLEVGVGRQLLGGDERGQLGEGSAVGLEHCLGSRSVCKQENKNVLLQKSVTESIVLYYKLTPSAHASVLDVGGTFALQQHEHLVASATGRYAVEFQLLNKSHDEWRDA